MQKIKQKIVSVTKKGQATLPKEMRERHGIGRKALAIETLEGILIKPLPKVEEEMGSLREIFKGKTARGLLADAQRRDAEREKRLEGLA
jgi:bifunctional DNA-binding transcriptional regulator/antitoxin component of YhaV-PrlF toxin-antitoxin module